MKTQKFAAFLNLSNGHAKFLGTYTMRSNAQAAIDEARPKYNGAVGQILAQDVELVASK